MFIRILKLNLAIEGALECREKAIPNQEAGQVMNSWTILINEKIRQISAKQGETIGFETR